MQKLIGAGILIACVYLLALPVRSSIQGKLAIPGSELEADTGIAIEQTGGQLAQSLAGKETAATPSSLYARSCCLMDARTGRVLMSKEAEQQLPMASTTKIMTCTLALELGNPKDWVEVSAYAASMPDVQLNIREGERYQLKDLLYSLMLESHNDTAVAIAEHIGGSVEGFAQLMNQKAQELGCVNTHFVTPNGLDADGHYTTARELCLIASYAIQNKDFLELISTPSHSFQDKKGNRKFTVYNHDAFLSRYKGAIGIKTGFTGKAGYCFVGAARRNGRTLVSSVLACGWPPNRSYKWADTAKLMDYGFDNYETVEIPVQDQQLSCQVLQGQEMFLPLERTETAPLSMLLCAKDTLSIWQEVPRQITAPVRRGDIIGYEKYAVNGEMVRQIPITASKDIVLINYSYWWKRLLHLLCF